MKCPECEKRDERIAQLQRMLREMAEAADRIMARHERELKLAKSKPAHIGIYR
jgi:hypothetical protein